MRSHLSIAFATLDDELGGSIDHSIHSGLLSSCRPGAGVKRLADKLTPQNHQNGLMAIIAQARATLSASHREADSMRSLGTAAGGPAELDWVTTMAQADVRIANHCMAQLRTGSELMGIQT